jgi:transposase
VVSHVDAKIKVCPRCDTRNKGRFPANISGPLQYGPGIKGYVMYMLIAQMVSLKRLQQSIRTLIGQVLSEVTILKYVMQLHDAQDNPDA